MQTVTLKIKLLPPNRGKLEKMARLLETYRRACSWFLEQAEALDTTSRAHLNRQTYRQACAQFNLNRGTLQCAISSGRSQIAVPFATSAYHASRLQDLAGGSCRQGSMEIWRDKSGEWYVAISLVYETCFNELGGVKGGVKYRCQGLQQRLLDESGSILASSSWPCCPTTCFLTGER